VDDAVAAFQDRVRLIEEAKVAAEQEQVQRYALTVQAQAEETEAEEELEELAGEIDAAWQAAITSRADADAAAATIVAARGEVARLAAEDEQLLLCAEQERVEMIAKAQAEFDAGVAERAVLEREIREKQSQLAATVRSLTEDQQHAEAELRHLGKEDAEALAEVREDTARLHAETAAADLHIAQLRAEDGAACGAARLKVEGLRQAEDADEDEAVEMEQTVEQEHQARLAVIVEAEEDEHEAQEYRQSLISEHEAVAADAERLLQQTQTELDHVHTLLSSAQSEQSELSTSTRLRDAHAQDVAALTAKTHSIRELATGRHAEEHAARLRNIEQQSEAADALESDAQTAAQEASQAHVGRSSAMEEAQRREAACAARLDELEAQGTIGDEHIASLQQQIKATGAAGEVEVATERQRYAEEKAAAQRG
ncbi:hypothetical protein B484DRAFT_410490, partial [Ochromonadaceae sp. CCMP2298]